MTLFSSTSEIARLCQILRKYARLPISSINIPGAVLESAFAFVREAEVLRTYDFVDVVERQSRCGWQMKSTLAGTPVTWKRAKIPDSIALIKASQNSLEGQQQLGDSILAFCNAHAQHSLEHYDLREIGYSRLIVHVDGNATYFERLLCTRDSPNIFEPQEFEWRWSIQKTARKKEQLSALHGIHKPSGRKWFAWHGLGENQLHFPGERTWWEFEAEEQSPHSASFNLPVADEKLTWEAFIELLAQSKVSS